MKNLHIKTLIIILLLLSSAIILVYHRIIIGTSLLPALGLSANDVEYIDSGSEVGYNGCQTPPDGFKSWTRGTIVTKLTPAINANCPSLFKGDNKREIDRVQNALRGWPIKEHTLKFIK